MRQLQATLTRIFIVLESESHGLSKTEKDFLAKIGDANGLSAQKQVITEKKRSSPKLRRILLPKSEMQTVFQAESRQLLHNFGSQITLGRGLFSFFQQESASKAPKTAILHTLQANGAYRPHRRSQGGGGGGRAPPNQNTTNDKKL